MAGSAPPPKPWERNRPASAALSSPGLPVATQSTGDTKPWEQSSSTGTSILEPRPQRPWESTGASSSYTGGTYSAGQYGSSSLPYNQSLPYGSSYGSSTPYNSYGSSYGNSAYGSGYNSSSPYGSSYGLGYNRSPYGGIGGSGYGGLGGSSYGGMYGSSYSPYGSSPYGGSMYGAGPYGAGPYGAGAGPGMQPPFDPAHPPAPPSAWQHFMHLIGGVMHFFGRLSFLVDENTHAVHFFISALLQLLDRAGSLYGEVARFILRLLGRKRKLAAVPNQPGQLPGLPENGGGIPPSQQQQPLALPATAASAPAAKQWDNLWGQ